VNQEPEETHTETSAFADLLGWSSDRPAWQKDALWRLALNTTLSNNDFDELSSLCLNPTLPHTPLSDAHVKQRACEGRYDGPHGRRGKGRSP
jgi:hypothetical protein